MTRRAEIITRMRSHRCGDMKGCCGEGADMLEEDAQMDDLEWTRDKPTEPGFYFYRPPGTSNPDHVWVAQVNETTGSGLFFSVASFGLVENLITHQPVSEKGIRRGFWWGPIPSPPPCHWRG